MKQFLIFSIIAFAVFSCQKDDIQPEVPVPDETEVTNLELLPHFGQLVSPNSADGICEIVSYLGDFDDNAYPVGQKVNDFTLYDKTGSAVNLKSKLLEGKPVFLMTGSYTCPVFRNKIAQLNELIATYGAEINFYVVYTVEAHPIIDNSGYADSIWTTAQNIADGILYEQPDTYGDRLSAVNDLTDAFTINCPILIDNNCNEFWTTYGEAPNRAYLIDQNGFVQISHGWFHYPSMTTSIDVFLAE